MLGEGKRDRSYGVLLGLRRRLQLACTRHVRVPRLEEVALHVFTRPLHAALPNAVGRPGGLQCHNVIFAVCKAYGAEKTMGNA
ncbi:hypothetical protein [Candidatus Methylacidithermus pantelleriae]|uniref:Uncharacterized protein n=1 Tax=Candidatus Methylacidithermus pantelleriae TaxID=2744239 RepID=A0A8J2BVK5_9BACT|nr:hypothetical protein [Candidatus Methylacidithermus pantelleriae]CAF0702469.1 hypothetical protein MPNT_50085 [Candidatus Methylacidithermus pantelleriae]